MKFRIFILVAENVKQYMHVLKRLKNKKPISKFLVIFKVISGVWDKRTILYILSAYLPLLFRLIVIMTIIMSYQKFRHKNTRNAE